VQRDRRYAADREASRKTAAARHAYWKTSAFAYPAGFADLVAHLRLGETSAIEPAVKWLEEDHTQSALAAARALPAIGPS
jgi:hypothetical protein